MFNYFSIDGNREGRQIIIDELKDSALKNLSVKLDQMVSLYQTYCKKALGNKQDVQIASMSKQQRHIDCHHAVDILCDAFVKKVEKLSAEICKFSLYNQKLLIKELLLREPADLIKISTLLRIGLDEDVIQLLRRELEALDRCEANAQKTLIILQELLSPEEFSQMLNKLINSGAEVRDYIQNNYFSDAITGFTRRFKSCDVKSPMRERLLERIQSILNVVMPSLDRDLIVKHFLGCCASIQSYMCLSATPDQWSDILFPWIKDQSDLANLVGDMPQTPQSKQRIQELFLESLNRIKDEPNKTLQELLELTNRLYSSAKDDQGREWAKRLWIQACEIVIQSAQGPEDYRRIFDLLNVPYWQIQCWVELLEPQDILEHCKQNGLESYLNTYFVLACQRSEIDFLHLFDEVFPLNANSELTIKMKKKIRGMLTILVEHEKEFAHLNEPRVDQIFSQVAERLSVADYQNFIGLTSSYGYDSSSLVNRRLYRAGSAHQKEPLMDIDDLILNRYGWN